MTLSDKHPPSQCQVTELTRHDFRLLFGVTLSHKWGYFVDGWMSGCIHAFLDWLEYPKGDHVLNAHSHPVPAAVVSFDGCDLYTSSFGCLIFKWNLLSNEYIHSWIAHDAPVPCLDLNRQGLLVSGGYDSRIRLWNTMDDHSLMHDWHGQRSSAETVRFNEKGDQLVSGFADGNIYLWSVETGECQMTLAGHNGGVTSVFFDGSMIISGSVDGSIKLWNPNTTTSKIIRLEKSFEEEANAPRIFDACLNADASSLACICQDSINVFSWPVMKMTRIIHSAGSYGQFHPLNPRLLAVDEFETHCVHIWDVCSGECILTFSKSHSSYIYGLIFTPDGSRMISVSHDKTVRIWDIGQLL